MGFSRFRHISYQENQLQTTFIQDKSLDGSKKKPDTKSHSFAYMRWQRRFLLAAFACF
jgi:hypothetical protein